MITYKDRAWCSRSTYCANEKCYRNYDVGERQENMDGVNLPISQTDMKTEDCGYEIVKLELG